MIITRNQLANNLKDMDQTVLATIRTCTVPDMKKTNNPFWGKVRKLQDMQACVGSWQYSKAVNARRKKEWENDLLSDDSTPKPEKFVPAKRQWGERVANTPYVEHNGQLYVELSVIKCLRQVYLDENGNELSKELLAPFFKNNEKEGARQDLDKPVIVRDVKIDNVVSITYGGHVIEVEDTLSLAPSKLAI